MTRSHRSTRRLPTHLGTPFAKALADPSLVLRIAGLGVVAGALLVVGLNISPTPPSGKTVIRYCQWSGVAQQPVVWEIKKAFERENPDIEVRLEFYSSAYEQKLYTMIAAGCAPDVWYTSPPRMIELARRGALEDLTPFIERDAIDMSEYYDVVTDSFKWRGRAYAMSMQFGAIALYYNRDLFHEAGLAYPNMRWEDIPATATTKAGRRMVPHPWNWDDLLAAAKALTRDRDGDGVTDQFGFAVNAGMEVYGASFIYQNGGRVMDERRERVTLDEPEAVGGLQFLQDLLWKHRVAPTPESVGTQGLGLTDLFETGKVAMAFDGSWQMSYYNRSGALNYDVAALPEGPRGHRGMVANGLANSMSATSKHKEAAWKWIKYYAGVTGRNDTTAATAQRLLGEMKRGIPIMKRIARSEVFLNPLADPENENVFLDQMDTAHDMWPCYAQQEWMTEKLGPELRILLDQGPAGGRTVAEAMAKITREANAIIERTRVEQARLDAARAKAGRR